jgi:hypothetical protein
MAMGLALVWVMCVLSIADLGELVLAELEEHAPIAVAGASKLTNFKNPRLDKYLLPDLAMPSTNLPLDQESPMSQ